MHSSTEDRAKYLGKYLAQKRDKTGKWSKLHNMELHNLYRNADIIRMFKLHRLWWAEHVAWMGDGRRAHKNVSQ